MVLSMTRALSCAVCVPSMTAFPTNILHESILPAYQERIPNAHVEFTTDRLTLFVNQSVTPKDAGKLWVRAQTPLPKTKLIDANSRIPKGSAPRKMYHACD